MIKLSIALWLSLLIQYNSYSTIIILITLKKIQYGYFSFSDISENKWTDIARISIIAELLALITQESLDMIDADFLLCSTVSWIQTLDESKSMFKTHPSKVHNFPEGFKIPIVFFQFEF